MDVVELDRADAAQVRALLLQCADVPRWADALVAGRPYADRDALLDAASRAATGWGADEVEQALADHPRIGERHPGDGGSARLSESEQSGVDAHDDEVARRLAEGNAAYEKRFGRVFLVRAAGRDGEEVLALLRERLTHDDETELRVTAEQLAEIALLRLSQAVTQDRQDAPHEVRS